MTSDGYTVAIASLRDSPATHPDMPIAEIRNADGGTDEVVVSRQSLIDGRLPIGFPVGRRSDGAMLIELPRETAQGVWRIYVPEGSLRREASGGGGRRG